MSIWRPTVFKSKQDFFYFCKWIGLRGLCASIVSSLAPVANQATTHIFAYQRTKYGGPVCRSTQNLIWAFTQSRQVSMNVRKGVRRSLRPLRVRKAGETQKLANIVGAPFSASVQTILWTSDDEEFSVGGFFNFSKKRFWNDFDYHNSTLRDISLKFWLSSRTHGTHVQSAPGFPVTLVTFNLQYSYFKNSSNGTLKMRMKLWASIK